MQLANNTLVNNKMGGLHSESSKFYAGHFMRDMKHQRTECILPIAARERHAHIGYHGEREAAERDRERELQSKGHLINGEVPLIEARRKIMCDRDTGCIFTHVVENLTWGITEGIYTDLMRAMIGMFSCQGWYRCVIALPTCRTKYEMTKSISNLMQEAVQNQIIKRFTRDFGHILLGSVTTFLHNPFWCRW